ncbi:NAD(P)H-dependent oxidoreductase [Enterococcus sulfureus]|nr:NAD(P)H-dependent oxidoreductase [Enterococcus sulfureus]
MMTTITLVVGSNQSYSRVQGLVEYCIDQFTMMHMTTHLIMVNELNHEALLTADFSHPDILEANQKIENSQAVLFFTPIYKASYSGILKTYLDLLPQKGLAEKIVYSLALGGSTNHVLALPYALEPVLKELGAEYLLQSTFIHQSMVTQLADSWNVAETARERIDAQLSKINQYEVTQEKEEVV